MTEPAQLAFDAWQTTPHSELDGEHTLRWDDLSDEYRAAWRTAIAAALAAPAPTFEPDQWCTGRRACEHHGACLYGCAAAPAPQPEPVAVIGPTWQLLWASGETLVETLARNPGLRIGSKLYAEFRAPSVQAQIEQAVAVERERWMAAIKLAHDYQGACPDEQQPDARDPDCPACRALMEAEAAPKGQA